jgi:hypothetical protein
MKKDMKKREEKDVLIEGLIERITRKTGENDHTKSVLELAKFLRVRRSEEILGRFIELQELYGSMPVQLIELRGNERQELMKRVEKRYGKVVAGRIEGAF